MTTVVVFLQRCMVIFAVFLCFFHAQSEAVDCELYPFHYTCRGTMSKRRGRFLPLSLNGLPCDRSKGDVNCLKTFDERGFDPYIPLPNSRLLIALLNDDIQKDITYHARHRQRNNDVDGRRTPLMQSFLSELEAKDDY